MKNIFYDIEIFEDFFLASFMVDGKFVDFSFHKTLNDKTLDKFRDFIVRLRKEKCQLIGYNNLKYDNNIIAFVINQQNKTIPDIHSYNGELWKAILSKEIKPNSLKLNCLDLIYFFKVGGSYKSLKEVAAEMGAENILECPVSFTQTETTVKDTKIITNYCHNDILLVKSIYESNKISDDIAVRTLISEKYGVPLAYALRWASGTLSDKMVEYLLGDSIKKKQEVKTDFYVGDLLDSKISYKTPTFNDMFKEVSSWKVSIKEGKRILNNGESYSALKLILGIQEITIGLGGVHLGDVFVLKTSDKGYVLDVDVKAYYPTLLKNLVIGPEGIEKEYSDIMGELIVQRDAAKTKGEKGALKLVLNSQTGKLESEFGLFYSPISNTKMVMNGQLIMLELTEALHLAGFVFAQINTDGLSVYISNEKQRKIFDDITSAWKTKWGFVLVETEYKALVQRDVNNYAGLKKDGTFKLTGFFNPDKMAQMPVVVDAVKNYLLQGTSIKETILNARGIELTKWAKRNNWLLKGDNLEGFNNHGVNRFYLAKNVNNEIKSKLEPLKTKPDTERSMKVAVNVMSANVLTDIDLNKVDVSAYSEICCKNIADYENGGIPAYNKNLQLDIESGKVLKKDIKAFSEAVRDTGIITESGSVAYCPNPDCGTTSGACKVYGDHLYCFKCRKYMTQAYLLDLINVSQAVNETICPSNSQDDIRTPEVIKDELPDIIWQGYVKEVADTLGKRDVDALFVALSSASALIQRKIQVAYGGGVPILGSGYYLLIKKTGSGKSTALNQIKEILNIRCDYDSDISSGQAIFNMISEPKIEGVGKNEKVTGYKAKPGVLISDEFKMILSSMTITSSTLGAILRQLFCYVGAFTVNKTSNVKTEGKTRQKVMNPTLSLIAVSTEREFFSGINPGLKENGFLNRFLFLPGSTRPFDITVTSKNQPKQKQLHLLNPIKTEVGQYVSDKYTGEIYSDEINEFLSEYIQHLHVEYSDKDTAESDVCGRLHVHLHRLVLMYGMMTGNKRPTLDNAKAAVEIIKMCEKYTLELFSRESDIVNNTPTSKMRNDVENSIIKYLERHGEAQLYIIKKHLRRKDISEGEFNIALSNLTSKDDPILETVLREMGQGKTITKFLKLRNEN